jgi:hypothetical protein
MLMLEYITIESIILPDQSPLVSALAGRPSSRQQYRGGLDVEVQTWA